MRYGNGIGWNLSCYFSHNGGYYYIPGVKYEDFGFHNHPNPPSDLWGSNRAMRHVARGLFSTNVSSPTPELKINDVNTKVWRPTSSQWYGNNLGEGYAWCGWETKTGESTTQKWGAIWRYKRKEDYWIPSNSITRDFIVSGNSNLSVSSLYRFNIGTASAPIISATGVGSVTTYQQSGNTHFNIPNVSENPLIIKFQ